MQNLSTRFRLFLSALFAVSFSAIQPATAQLQVYDTIVGTPASQATQLAQHLVGMGVQVSNAQLNCPGGAWGTFNGANSNIGLTTGALLTTGSIQNAIGPNNQQDATTDNGTGGDLTLSAVINDTSYDACVLEFDVIPQNDTLTFDYVFGSEEYLEFVGLGFNDAFGFFISGPGIAGRKNMARIPGTNLPVSINSVNSNANSSFYVDNGDGTTPGANPSVQYDGFTVVLTAQAGNLLPNATYHLKLVLADVSDHDLDSGVFLKAGSLGSASATGRPQQVAYTTVSSVYPNPSVAGSSVLKLGVLKADQSQVVVEVYDAMGRLTLTQSANLENSQVNSIRLQTGALTAGLYQYLVKARNEVVSAGQFSVLR